MLFKSVAKMGTFSNPLSKEISAMELLKLERSFRPWSMRLFNSHLALCKHHIIYLRETSQNLTHKPEQSQIRIVKI